MVNETLLRILRCPVAVRQDPDNPDAGQLELVHGCWLVCQDSGCKYPIIEDIPVMLVEIGKKYRETAIEDLPVPPPKEDASPIESQE
jgi:hypothetical protein